MRRLLSLVVMLAIVIGLVGWWRGWFTVAKVDNDKWTVSVDKDKLKQDEQAAKQALKNAENGLNKDTSGATK